MSTKLTLYIEDELISYVKQYAKSHHLSVSKVVNNFFTGLKYQDSKHTSDDTPLTDSLLGSVKMLDTSKEAYHKHLDEKYQ
jgi:hypothetical protein